ncbi:MAG: SDR family oxidoreductase, partial [Pseudomonadales bacterium]
MNSKPSSNPYRSDLLAGKCALVTGAGKGIGRESAIRLAQCGATVIAVARTEQDLISLAQEIGPLIIPCVMDASTEDFLAYIESIDNIDILVNNLGTNVPQNFVDVEDEVFERMLDLNVRVVFKITRAVVRKMLAAKTQGSIINITSQMGHVGSPR